MSDDWMKSRFTSEERLSATLVNQECGGPPSFSGLKTHLDKYGPDGVLEAAVGLPQHQFERLEELVKQAPVMQRLARRRKR